MEHIVFETASFAVDSQSLQVPSIPWSGDGLTAELTAEGTIPDEAAINATLIFGLSEMQ